MATRKTPELNLKEAEPLVLSRDFNLIYRPETEPLPQGTANFLKSLDNFVRGTGSQLIVASELKQKKEQSAKAIKDHAELKTKFRTAISEGKIKPTANPYYLEKYKELSLNAYASQFSDSLAKAYIDNDIAEDITEGAFDRFYADQLKTFITKNNLGQFEPTELEKGFFIETSAYRNQLEATHKSNLINNFTTKFDNQVKAKVVGVIQKYKNFDVNTLNERGQPVNKFQLIADELQDEISSLIEVNGDGRKSIDTVFDGLKLYVSQTTDINFAKSVIKNVPKLLVGGTGSVADIGRIKTEQNELTKLLLEKSNERLANEINHEKHLATKQNLETFAFLEKEIKDNPEFSVTDWKNEEGRTQDEKDGAELFLKSQRFDGGASDNKEAIRAIERLIKEDNFIEASKLVAEYFELGEIRKGTYENYINIRIKNAFDQKDNTYFDIPVISKGLLALEKTIETGRGGDSQDAVYATSFIRNKLGLWLKATETNPQLIARYENNEELKMEDFEKKYISIVNNLKKYGGMSKLFGEGTAGLEGSGTVMENIEAKIAQGIEQDEDAQIKVDMKALSDEDFLTKYGKTKKEMEK